MSDLFYQIVRAVGRPIIFAASHCVVLHEERAHLSGGFLLAANHQSYFESMVLVGTTTRRVDWLSIVELFQTPWQRCFMRGLNCLPLARQRRDVPTFAK